MSILHFCLSASLISLHDVRFHKVRRKHVYLSLITLLPWMKIDALSIAIFNLGIYLLLFVLSRGKIGFGDVRLAFLIGMYLGLLEIRYSEVLLVNLISWCAASLFVMGRWISNLSSGAVPFAPFMFLSVVAAAFNNGAELL
ncbi:MAG: hypothetical protein FGM47_00415 [Candidatus Nanopelagicaceae bacterium]|nr:hypothetical protein [Candidatus Nanopelagicaceae bacterium]